MAAPTAGTPELDILGRLEKQLDDSPVPPANPEDARETSEEEPKVELPEDEEGEEPIAAKEEGEEGEEGEEKDPEGEEKDPESAEVGDEEVRTMSDLAKMFEVDEKELLNHLEVEGPNGVSVPLAKALDTYKNSTVIQKSHDELAAERTTLQAEAAQLRVTTDATVKEMAIQTQVLLDVTQQEFSDINWKTLEVEDPQQFLIMKSKQQERGQLIQRAIEKMRGLEHQRAGEAQAVNLETRQKEMVTLHTKKPEWKDAAVAQTAMSDTQSFLSESGFSQEEINGITDHRYLLVAYEASQYRKLKNQTPKKIDKLRSLPKPKHVLRSSARKGSGEVARKQSQKNLDRLKATGDERDAARLFEEMI
jgi:hypothetical protein